MISPELLRRYPFFSHLSADSLSAVAMLAEEVSCGDSVLMFESDQAAEKLFFLVEGGIDLHYVVRDKDNPMPRKDFFVGHVNPGEPFGISALIEPYRYTASAFTNGKSRILKIDGLGLRALCREDVALSSALMRNIAKVALLRLHETRIQLAAAQS